MRFQFSEKIPRFENISSEDWNKIYLTNLSENESQGVFDLRVNSIDGTSSGIGFDYIVDPTPGATNVSNCSTLSSANTYYQLNSSIVENAITTDCIIISAQNITFDCDGYYIKSNQNYSGVF